MFDEGSYVDRICTDSDSDDVPRSRDGGVMAVIKLPRFMGGGTRPEPQRKYSELQIMEGMGTWLAHCETLEEQFRALAYWMWRLKSGHDPRMDSMVENIAEECAEQIGEKVGFKRAANNE